MSDVLIIGQRAEPHVSTVGKLLSKNNLKVSVLDRYSLPDLKINLSSSKIGEFVLNEQFSNGVVSPKVVWYRQKSAVPATSVKADFEDNSDDSAYWLLQWDTFNSGLDEMFFDSHWISPIRKQKVANNKIIQYSWATNVGLTIPDTIITNDPVCIEKHLTGSKMIFKSLGEYVFSDFSMVTTTRVNKKFIIEHKDNIKSAPGIYQKYINKDHELRITVIGDEVIPVKINSQKHKKTKFDWRMDQLADMYEETELPEYITKKILNYMNVSGLKYGAFDFVVSPDGQYVFLECNPVGQWLWMEYKIGVPISSKIADYIINQIKYNESTD